MRLLKSIKYDWLNLVSIVFFAICFGFCVYVLVVAWSSVQVLYGKYFNRWVSYDTEPFQFFWGLGFTILATVVIAGVLLLLVHGLRAERRYFRRRERRPPLEEGVREPLDRGP